MPRMFGSACTRHTRALPLIAYLWNRFSIVRTSCDAWLSPTGLASPLRRAALSCTQLPLPRQAQQQAVSRVLGPAHHSTL